MPAPLSIVDAVPTRRQSLGRWKFLDLTARLSGSHLKSLATAGTCQELRWTKPWMMACSSVTVPKIRNSTAHPLGLPDLKCFFNATSFCPGGASRAVGSPRMHPALPGGSRRTRRSPPTADRCRPLGGVDLKTSWPKVERGSHCQDLPLRDRETLGKGVL